MGLAMIKEKKGEIGQGPKAVETWVEKEVNKQRKPLVEKFGYRAWVNLLPLASAPAWIINTDVVRRMIGMRQSLISYFQTEDGLIDSSLIPPDPSIAAESFLWIPALSIADPTWLLPITLWALVASQVYLRLKDMPLMSLKKRQNLPSFKTRLAAEVSTRLRELGVLFGVCLGPFLIIAEIPSALVLYWVAASGTLILERFLVRRIVKLGKPLVPAAPMTARMKERVAG